MRRVFIALVVSSIAVLGAPRARACSMCHCSDPTFALVRSQLFVPRTFSLGLDADRFSKDQGAEDAAPGREAEVENRVTLSGGYTLARRFSVVLRVPFADRMLTGPEGSESQSGISDPELLLHYRVAAPRPGSWVSIGAGARPGWGQSEAQRDGERLEEHLQPGTGAFGWSLGGAFSHVVGAADDGSVYGSLTGRLNTRNDHGYRYGDALLVYAGYERRLGGWLNGVLEANFRHAARDEVAVGEPDPNSGGSVLYLTPRLIVKLDRKHFLRLGVQIPVFESLYGDQDEKVNVFTGVTLRF
jgi:hypothetical protein